MTANERQVGGDHYKQADGGEEHWDRVHRLGLDYFQANITKYVERWKLKNGIEDLHKARHYLDKYIELNTPKPTLESVTLDLSKTAHASQVKAWWGYTFEGGTKDWDLFRCNTCREEVRVTPGSNPHDAHTHPEEPTKDYVNQDRGEQV